VLHADLLTHQLDPIVVKLGNFLWRGRFLKAPEPTAVQCTGLRPCRAQSFRV